MNFVPLALSLGFLGSFHCIGMCGPIALALPYPGNSMLKRLNGSLVYNSGRVITYALFGALFGAFGQGLALAGYQQILSIAIGALILAGVLLPTRLLAHTQLTRPLYHFISVIRSRISGLFEKKDLRTLFIIGLANGLLPCGLVYLGIAGAIATGSVLQGAAFMALFGSATLPVMFTLPLTGSFISTEMRVRVRKAMPFIIGVLGLLFIVRGMNLGIPYLSPAFEHGDTLHVKCCHK